MLIEVDNEVSEDVLADVRGIAGIREARSVKLG
jgi:hypothetical protein